MQKIFQVNFSIWYDLCVCLDLTSGMKPLFIMLLQGSELSPLSFYFDKYNAALQAWNLSVLQSMSSPGD